MEILKKYPKSFQWLFLLIVFFGLCFAIEVPEGYKFIRSIAEYSKDPNLSSLELSVSEKIGLKVIIKNNKRNKGTITFSYHELEQLNKIIDIVKANY